MTQTPTKPDAVVEPNTSGFSETDINRIAEAVAGMMRSGSATPTVPTATPELVHGLAAGEIFRNGPANIQEAGDISSQTVALVQQSRADIQRAGITTATGFIGYDLKSASGRARTIHDAVTQHAPTRDRSRRRYPQLESDSRLLRRLWPSEHLGRSR